MTWHKRWRAPPPSCRSGLPRIHGSTPACVVCLSTSRLLPHTRYDSATAPVLLRLPQEGGGPVHRPRTIACSLYRLHPSVHSLPGLLCWGDLFRHVAVVGGTTATQCVHVELPLCSACPRSPGSGHSNRERTRRGQVIGQLRPHTNNS